MSFNEPVSDSSLVAEVRRLRQEAEKQRTKFNNAVINKIQKKRHFDLRKISFNFPIKPEEGYSANQLKQIENTIANAFIDNGLKKLEKGRLDFFCGVLVTKYPDLYDEDFHGYEHLKHGIQSKLRKKRERVKTSERILQTAARNLSRNNQVASQQPITTSQNQPPITTSQNQQSITAGQNLQPITTFLNQNSFTTSQNSQPTETQLNQFAITTGQNQQPITTWSNQQTTITELNQTNFTTTTQSAINSNQVESELVNNSFQNSSINENLLSQLNPLQPNNSSGFNNNASNSTSALSNHEQFNDENSNDMLSAIGVLNNRSNLQNCQTISSPLNTITETTNNVSILPVADNSRLGVLTELTNTGKRGKGRPKGTKEKK